MYFNKLLQLFSGHFFIQLNLNDVSFLDLFICFSYSTVSKSAPVLAIIVHTEEGRKTIDAVTLALTVHSHILFRVVSLGMNAFKH